MNRRTAGWGGVALVVYVATALLSAQRFPVRPLFDGLAPPSPYHWVSPPPDSVGQNTPPTGASQRLGLKPGGTDEASVATLDGQTTLILPQGAFADRRGDKDVSVDITPENPAKYGSPPSGLGYAGNAYTIRARYDPSSANASPALNITVLLQYPTLATTILQKTSNGPWSKLPTTDVAASLQVFAKTKSLGTFAAAGHQAANALRWWTLGIASGIAALLGTTFGLRERRRLRRPPRRVR
jgi:hypothetical protein